MAGVNERERVNRQNPRRIRGAMAERATSPREAAA